MDRIGRVDTREAVIQYRTLSIQLSNDQKKAGGLPAALAHMAATSHTSSLREIELTFGTSAATGLMESSAANRLRKYGKNMLPPPPSYMVRKILTYVFGGFCSLLWVAGIVCVLAWNPLSPDPSDAGALMNLWLAIVIFLTVIIQALFNGYQDWSSSQVMKSINSMLASSATVVRDGKQIEVPASDVCVGDLVVLKYGSKVPADLRLVEVQDLRFDRSMLTGESEPVEAAVDATEDNYLETRNIAPMGTLVTNGHGRGIVVGTGAGTIMATIAGMAAGSSAALKSTVLQREITRFVILIAAMSITTTVTVIVLWAAWLRTTYPGFMTASAAVVNAISVMVAFVPEGLPVAVALTLTLVARAMQKRKILVRNLTTVETLGSVNVIASDKTGTLTMGKMHVDEIYSADSTHVVRELVQNDFARSVGFRLLQAAGRLCNASVVDYDSMMIGHTIAHESDWRIAGDPTDTAIMRFSLGFGGAKVQGEKAESGDSGAELLHSVPFNSRNKWMLTVHGIASVPSFYSWGQYDVEKSAALMLIKGAPDVLVGRLSRKLLADGSEAPLTADDLGSIEAQQFAWSSTGKRVILIASKRAPRVSDGSASDVYEQSVAAGDLCFMGMYAIVDPPRPDIEKVIATCRGAGVRIFMVTGDHALTAQSIARMIGIISPESTVEALADVKSAASEALVRDTKAGTKTALVMSGPELVGLTDEQWAVVTEYDEIVFARTTPAQKLEIVERMQKRGNVVGVTGDGVNDAPALKTADIGIAMGGGSDVAVEASAMVLLDNNFGSMVEAIRNGRLVFDNLQKVILYLLPAGSFSELIPTLFAFLLGCPMLLSPFLMIVICVFTDMISSIALMYEKPEANLLQRKPRNPRQTRLASAKLILHAYFFTGVLECLFASCMFFVYMYRYHAIAPSQVFLAYNEWNPAWNKYVNVGQCVYFVSLIMTQCFGNLQCIRARYVPLWRHPMNWAVIASTVSTVVIALFVMYAPFMNKAFGTAAIPAEFWFFPVAFSVLLVAANEVLKWNRRTNDNFLTRYWW